MEQLDPQALEKISGPSWDALRDSFVTISKALLGVSHGTRGQLTTIYVKYTTSSDPSAEIYAVVWIKTSKQLTVGLALPQNTDDELLGSAPAGTRYKGLTKYFSLRPGEAVPEKIDEWAKLAYSTVSNRQDA